MFWPVGVWEENLRSFDGKKNKTLLACHVGLIFEKLVVCIYL